MTSSPWSANTGEESPDPSGTAADGGPRDSSRRSHTRWLLEQAADCDGVRRDTLLAEVVLLNRGVAKAVARRYRGRGVSDDDLEQSAYEGLVKAVRRFDPAIREDLLVYAVPTVRGEVRRLFRDQSWMVRPPRRVQELQWRVTRSSERLAQRLGRPPTRLEIGADLDCDRAEVEEAFQGFGCFTPTSLDRRVGPDGAVALGELLPTPDDHGIDAVEARVALAPVVRQLSERDRHIVYLRFFEGRNQRDIGAELGVTQMQVSRLIQRILATLRHGLDGPPATGT